MKFRLKLFVAIAAFASLIVPGVAAAHVTVTPEEAPAEGYAMLFFTVPHGCDDAATTSVSVKMPRAGRFRDPGSRGRLEHQDEGRQAAEAGRPGRRDGHRRRP